MQKQISSKQYVIIVFLILMAQKIFLLPALLIKTGGRDGYLSLAIMLAVEIVFLLLISIAVRRNNGNLFHVLDSGATKIGGRIISAVVLVFLFIKLMLVMGELRVFFNTTLSDSLITWQAFIPLCLWLFFIGTKTLRGIGRLGEILIPFILIAIVVIVCLVLGNVSFNWAQPFLENGIRPVGKNVLMYPMWFGDISVLVLFLGQVKCGKHFVKISIVSAIVSSLVILFFTAMLFASYADIPKLLDYGSNISNMLLYSSSSYIYGRFDIPVFCIWVLCVFVQLALVFYAIVRHGTYILGVKNNKLVSGGAALAAYMIFVFVFKSEHSLLYFCTTVFSRVVYALSALAVPLFLFMCVMCIKKSKNSGLLRLNTHKQFKKAKAVKNEA